MIWGRVSIARPTFFGVHMIDRMLIRKVKELLTLLTHVKDYDISRGGAPLQAEIMRALRTDLRSFLRVFDKEDK